MADKKEQSREKVAQKVAALKDIASEAKENVKVAAAERALTKKKAASVRDSGVEQVAQSELSAASESVTAKLAAMKKEMSELVREREAIEKMKQSALASKEEKLLSLAQLVKDVRQ